MALRIFQQWGESRSASSSRPKVHPYKALDQIEELPAFSDVTMRALAVAGQSRHKADDFVDVIRHDGAITASLLRVANSVRYQTKQAATTVKDAVVSMGMAQCRSLVAALGMKATFKPADPSVRGRCDKLWRHSLLTAYVATHLSRALNLQFRGEEFTSALLHDVGRLVLTITDVGAAEDADPLDFDEGPAILNREDELLGINHARLGEEYGRRQNFPEPVLQAIRYHHFPDASPTHRRLVDLVHAADDVTNHVLRYHRVSDYRPDDCPSFTRLPAGTGSRGAQLNAVVRSAMRDTRAILQLDRT